MFEVYVDFPSGDCFLLPFLAVPFSLDLILFRLNPHLGSVSHESPYQKDLRVAHVFDTGVTPSPFGASTCMAPDTAVHAGRRLKHGSRRRSSFVLFGRCVLGPRGAGSEWGRLRSRVKLFLTIRRGM